MTNFHQIKAVKDILCLFGVLYTSKITLQTILNLYQGFKTFILPCFWKRNFIQEYGTWAGTYRIYNWESSITGRFFEIDCAIFYTNLLGLFCQFISWANWVNSGKFMDNCWISSQSMADMESFYDDLIVINL